MTYISGPYSQGQLLKEIHEIEIALTERFKRDGAITDAAEKKSWRDRVLEASMGRNTVMYDDQGNPSVMVLVPMAVLGDLIAYGGNAPHPAFIVSGQVKAVLHISKYQNIIVGSGASARALSLKYQDPANNISFDNSLAACQQKGEGWHLMTNAEWAAIALTQWKKGFLCRGNNSYGKDYVATSEKGIPSYYSGDNIARVLTGSGPLPWTHDGTPFGIFDLNGNVREWIGGFRINDGEINIIQDNNAALYNADHGVASALWKAILEDGSLVAPGTASTLNYDATGAGGTGSIIVKTGAGTNLDPSTSAATMFKDLTAPGVLVPNILKTLALYPDDTTIPTGRVYARSGERLPGRGGGWSGASGAGLFSLYLYDSRSYTYANIGFRSAFVL